MYNIAMSSLPERSPAKLQSGTDCWSFCPGSLYLAMPLHLSLVEEEVSELTDQFLEFSWGKKLKQIKHFQASKIYTGPEKFGSPLTPLQVYELATFSIPLALLGDQ